MEAKLQGVISSCLFKQTQTAGCLYRQPAQIQPIKRRDFPTSVKPQSDLRGNCNYIHAFNTQYITLTLFTCHVHPKAELATPSCTLSLLKHTVNLYFSLFYFLFFKFDFKQYNTIYNESKNTNIILSFFLGIQSQQRNPGNITSVSYYNEREYIGT